MTTPFMNFFLVLLTICCFVSTTFVITHKNQTSQLKYTERRLKHDIDSLKSVIESQTEEIEILEDQIQQREIEITYWGMKYDSCHYNY